jgi:FkbM family methyltransferase
MRKLTLIELVDKLLLRLGLIRNQLSLEAVLGRCCERGARVNTVIDVGASNGCWSRRVVKRFPQAYFLMVEARHEHEKGLQKAVRRYPNFDYVVAAAGNRVGTIYFDATQLFGGLASDTPFECNCIEVPVTTIDTLVREKGLKPPFLIKLDTHGFEVPIFEGARQTLEKTSLIVVEVYNFKLTESSLRFHEMCAYLEERGFRCIDMSEPMHRFSDGAFWQMDLFFIPADSKEFASNSYEGTLA